MTLDDEVRAITGHIIYYIRSVDYGRDFERQLSFYVECRATFSGLDGVTAFLVHCVNGLAMETRRIVKSVHTAKTAPFVRACVAYTFITIPSLNSQIEQFRLYILSGQVALCNQCFSQGIFDYYVVEP